MCVCVLWGVVHHWDTGIEGTKVSLLVRPFMEETQERQTCRMDRFLTARKAVSYGEQIPGRGSMWAKTKVGMEVVRLSDKNAASSECNKSHIRMYSPPDGIKGE